MTARGRHQYRLLVQRKIDHIFEEKKAKGEPEARKKIELDVLKQEAEKFK